MMMMRKGKNGIKPEPQKNKNCQTNGERFFGYSKAIHDTCLAKEGIANDTKSIKTINVLTKCRKHGVQYLLVTKNLYMDLMRKICYYKSAICV